MCHQLLQACRLLTNNEYESKQTWEMDVDELFEKDETGAGTLTMISAEVIGLLKEYLEKQQNEVNYRSLCIFLRMNPVGIILFYSMQRFSTHTDLVP